MRKSINDLRKQVQRIIDNGCSRFCPSELYQMAARIAAERGLNMFDDHDKVGEFVPSAKNARRTHEKTKVVECTTQRVKVAQTAEKRPQNEKEREEWERALNATVTEQRFCKLLAWVELDVLMHTELGVAGDPLELPRRIYAAMADVLGDNKQGRMF